MKRFLFLTLAATRIAACCAAVTAAPAVASASVATTATAAIATTTTAPAGAEALTVRLWPETFFDGAALPPEETVASRGDSIIRVTGISDPSLLLFRADGEKASGQSDGVPGAPAVPAAPATPSASGDDTASRPAVLICPGGGYKHLALNIEGTEVAAWLNSIGVTAVVLKYRVPQNRLGAFQDVQRAMGLIRHQARGWGIDPNRVGILGFSAGAHLAARAAGEFDNRSYPPVDEADKLSCRPDFTILVYPAYLADKQYQLNPEITITARSPCAFVVQTQDDRAFFTSSMAYTTALQKVGVPTELHLFASGGHGYGLRPSRHPVSGWPRLCEEWLRAQGVIRTDTD